ncbi:hypothetical protein Baya_16216 [Bagarius yarrelli]|uniref:Uncharacterized protein n=1 Tax=Bagarius yarrelli TaxID=175774 RepID=A0A556VVC5_BAGYA|nr:hypothetical protein Baya_16216 [Bagarius yarrelli]
MAGLHGNCERALMGFDLPTCINTPQGLTGQGVEEGDGLFPRPLTVEDGVVWDRAHESPALILDRFFPVKEQLDPTADGYPDSESLKVFTKFIQSEMCYSTSASEFTYLNTY